MRLQIDVSVVAKTEQEKSLWYEVDRAYEGYLYSDRVDMFVVAILPYCMLNGYDIRVSDHTGVSADLLYQLREILIPSMKEAKPLKQIRIDAVPIYESLQEGTGIATGVSRGVDSFYTILRNMDGLFPLTHLTLFNVQAFGEYGGRAARKNFQKDLEKARSVCEALNRDWGRSLELVTVDSNIQDELPVSISFAGTLRDAGAILLLKQMFRLYYFSADTKLDTFEVRATGRFFSPWIYYCLSTAHHRIQLFGADMDRIDKVEYISKFPVTYDNLWVCRGPLAFGTKGMEYQSERNCTCDCDKCRHTVLELIASGRIESYAHSFDLKRLKKKYPELLAEAVSKRDTLFNKEIYQRFCEKGLLRVSEQPEPAAKPQSSSPVLPNRDQNIVEMLDGLLQRLQAGHSFTAQLAGQGYRTAAIYGMGRLGRRLYDVLRAMTVYTIDQNSQTVYGDVPLLSPDEELPPVDLILITTSYDTGTIRAFLEKKVSCRLMTLKELLEADE